MGTGTATGLVYFVGFIKSEASILMLENLEAIDCFGSGSEEVVGSSFFTGLGASTFLAGVASGIQIIVVIHQSVQLEKLAITC